MGQKKISLCLIDWMAKNACKLGTSCTWILWHWWHEQKKHSSQKKKIKKKILYLNIYHDSCFLLVFLLLYSLSRSYISCNDCQLIIMNWIRGIPYVDYLTVVDHLTVITEYIVNVLNIVKVMLFESFIIYTYIIYK